MAENRRFMNFFILASIDLTWFAAGIVCIKKLNIQDVGTFCASSIMPTDIETILNFQSERFQDFSKIR